MTGSFTISESIERDAWIDLFQAAPPHTRAALGLEVARAGGAVALTASRAETPMLNRAIGAGAGALAAVADHYTRRGVRRYFVQVHRGAEQDANDRAARAAGLVRYRRAWAKFLRGADPAPSIAAPPLDLAPATAADGDAVGALFCAVFDLPGDVAPMIAATIGRPRWDVWVARDDGAVVAFGLLYATGGVGYLAGAGTAASHRRRGAQGALMAARVDRAVQRGCRWLASETGEAVPGDPQHSYRNMLKCGFQVVGIRDNYAPAGMIWNHGTTAA